MNGRGVILSFAAAYAVALVTLIVSRLILNLPAEVQFLLPAAVSLLTLYVASVAWPIMDSPGGGQVQVGGVAVAWSPTAWSSLPP